MAQPLPRFSTRRHMAAAGGGDRDHRLREKLTDEQREEYEQVFKELDEDNSGMIDTKEVKTGLEQSGMTPSDEEVRQMVARFDMNNDNELDLEEWLELAATVFLGKSERELQSETFRMFDTDNKGYITKEDVQGLVTRLGVSVDVPGSDFDALVRSVNTEREGHISQAELVKLLDRFLPAATINRSEQSGKTAPDTQLLLPILSAKDPTEASTHCC